MTELRRNEAWAFVFFTLKDPTSGACLRATMQRRRFDALDARARGRRAVLVEGRAEIYEAKGELSFRAITIERIGLGDHLAAIERLKRTLAAEGMFAADRKRPLPLFPRAVGVVTGADAAASGDLVAGIRARFPAAARRRRRNARAGAGRGPAHRLALRRVAAHPCVDVVIVARGGGSFEDLLPFSDEAVVRAFSACPVPVVSAVGHEQDTPLCDLAADVRASTPTAAARLVVPDSAELKRGLERLRDRLDAGRSPRARARPRAARTRAGDRLRAAPAAPPRAAPGFPRPAGARLQALSPRATLARGYAVVRAGGTALRDAAAVAPGSAARDRARGGRPRGDGRGGTAVSEREADRRGDVRGAPSRARGDRREARARRRRSRRGDPALATRRGAASSLRAPARGRRGADRGAGRAHR